MLRIARRYSESAADAEDAFQRAMEKLLTRGRTEARDLPAWLATVTRNEALMIRRSRGRAAPSSVDDVAEAVSSDRPTPEESLLTDEGTSYGREALRRLKPDQLRCLLLRADGLSYDEIAAATSFSFAKVQRSLWEGRRAFQAHVSRLESGEECRRIEPLLSTYADGASGPAARRDVELHLENCLACRATLRDFRSTPNDVAAVLPLGAFVGESIGRRGGVGGLFENIQAWLNERIAVLAGGSHAAEAAFVKKASLATAVTLTAVAGGAGVVKVSQPVNGQDFVAAQPPVVSAARDAGRTPVERRPLVAEAAGASIAGAADVDGELSAAELLDSVPENAGGGGGVDAQVDGAPQDTQATVPLDDGTTDEPFADTGP